MKLGRERLGRQAKTIRTDDAGADVHVLLQGPRRARRPSRSIRSTTCYSGKIPAAKYADKIVLIGATAAGVGATPGDADLAGDDRRC